MMVQIVGFWDISQALWAPGLNMAYELWGYISAASSKNNYSIYPLPTPTICDIILCNMAIKVTRKDQGEANENIIRRFNRKVLQGGIMPLKKSQMRFSKPISKRERRAKAIIREARKAEKAERIKLGLR